MNVMNALIVRNEKALIVNVVDLRDSYLLKRF